MTRKKRRNDMESKRLSMQDSTAQGTIRDLIDTLTSSVHHILETVKATREEIQSLRSELSEIRSDISGLTSKVNDIEIITATHSDTIIKIQAELKDIRKKETHGSGPLTDKVLILENSEKKDNIIAWNLKAASVPEASTKMEHLLENFLQLRINFEVKEAHDKFVKIRLMNSDDQFSVLQANKQLRDQLWKKDLDKATKFDYNGVFFSDDVSKTCREIRATLNKKKERNEGERFYCMDPTHGTTHIMLHRPRRSETKKEVV